MSPLPDSAGGAGSGGVEWLRGTGPSADVVLSSRVRLARNFAGFPFPCRANEHDRAQVLELAHRHVLSGAADGPMSWVDLAGLTLREVHLLVERHLISKQLAEQRGPRAVAVSGVGERLAVMVNEEDHLRLQVMRSGLALRDAAEQMDRVDDAIESSTDFAFSPRFGYLTACPTNVGTGLRVSVMLHLPALKLNGEIEKVRRAAKAMSLEVRGFYGEGSEAVGDYFQLSNQTTLGKSEDELLEGFEQDIVPKVVEYERLARRDLIEKKRTLTEDRVFRALGALRGARLLKVDEAMQLMSLVRLGVVGGIVEDVSASTLSQLVLVIQPAHLQQTLGRSLSQAERRVERATLVRRAMAGGGRIGPR